MFSVWPGGRRRSQLDTHGACSFDLAFRAVMPPFDTHDPEQNPLVAAGETDMGYGDAWANGHLDVIGHITGELELRGKRYRVDCYDGMGRSWGPREEWGGRAVSWLHIPFGEEFGVHIAVTIALRDGRIVYDQLRFGYLHENGEVTGIVDARVTAERVNMIPVSNHVWIKDARGREFEFRGTAVAGSPYYQFIPAYVCFHTLLRYQDGDRVAHAEMGDIFGAELPQWSRCLQHRSAQRHRREGRGLTMVVPNVSQQLSAIRHTIAKTIIPALHPDARFAHEQAGLVLASLDWAMDVVESEHRYELVEHADHHRLLEALLALGQADGADDARTTLDASAAGPPEDLASLRAHIVALERYVERAFVSLTAHPGTSTALEARGLVSDVARR